jgi:hypothetical protein
MPTEREWRAGMVKWWPFDREPTEQDENIFRSGFEAAERQVDAENFKEVARESVQVLEPNPGAAVVVVRIGGYEALSSEDFDGLDLAIKDKMRDPDLMVVFLGPRESIESLSEKDMSERGWRRA